MAVLKHIIEIETYMGCHVVDLCSDVVAHCKGFAKSVG